jgi:arsenate reductase-like glutaredoxin family protein
MLDNPAIIKRPILETGQERIVGFSKATYTSLFSG